MGHIKEQSSKLHSSLLKRRQKKEMAILNGYHGQSDGLQRLITKTHLFRTIEDHLFSKEDLCSGQRPAETTDMGPGICLETRRNKYDFTKEYFKKNVFTSVLLRFRFKQLG